MLVIATPNPRALGFRVLRRALAARRRPAPPVPDRPRGARRRARRRPGLELVALTDVDPGGLHWNAFAWHYALRRPGCSLNRDKAAHLAGRMLARALAPVERRGLRGAAYTAIFRKR